MQTDKMSIPELMKHYSYKYVGSCNCDGYETHNWQNEDNRVYIKWRKYRQVVMILLGRKVLADWIKVTEFETKLKEVHEVIQSKKEAQDIS